MLSKRNIYSIGIAFIIFLTGLFAVNLFWYRPFFIKHFFWKEMILSLKNSPQTASNVDLPFFFKKSQFHLNDISIETLEKEKQHLESYSASLQRYDNKFLTRSRLLDKRIVQWHLEQELKSMDYIFHENLLNPFNGIQVELPVYLADRHLINSKKDAEAYLARVQQIPTQLRAVKTRMKQAQSIGILPPKKLLQQSILQMESFRRTDAENCILYLAFKSKLDSLKGGRYKDKMLEDLISLIQNEVYPAYDNLIIYARKLHQEASIQQGLINQPGGSEYYQFLIHRNSSLMLSPDTLYTIANAEIIRLKDEMVKTLKARGKESSPKNVIEKWAELSQTPTYVIGNSIQSRLNCKEQLDSLVQESKRFVAEHLFELPKAEVQVKRVPEFRDFWAPFSYYQNPLVQEESTGYYYFSMNALDHLPLFDWPTITHIETYPGKHFLFAICLENREIPVYRKRFSNHAFTEGWSMYAAELMAEKGFYEDKPYEYLALLKTQLFKAASMVADIGIHHKKWSRDNAIVFLEKNSTLNRRRINVEVDQLLAKPGEAVGSTIGYLKIMELRERSKVALKEEFDLEEFHRVILENGIVPLFILEDLVNEYIEEKHDKKGS